VAQLKRPLIGMIDRLQSRNGALGSAQGPPIGPVSDPARAAFAIANLLGLRTRM
jgi:hypothetical protein